MQTSTPALHRFAGALDRFAEATGGWLAWLILPLVLVALWEVAARYVFDAPTMWAYETIYMLCAAMFMLGAAYALRTGAHVRTDVLWSRWSPRKRALIDTFAYAVFFFPAMVLILWVGAEAAWISLLTDERSPDTAWRPPLWPLKTVVPLAAALLLVQGMSELAKSMHALLKGERYEPREGPPA
jgi:TRAP-type mannitol/chloroaromatic compound transport system permease small subunit